MMEFEEMKRERDLLCKYIELIRDQDLPEVKMILQQYAARGLNQQYKKDTEKATR